MKKIETIIGPALFALNPVNGKLLSRIGTVFLRTPGLVTAPGIHAMQRLMWVDHLNKQRAEAGQPPLTDSEAEAEMTESVDLLFDENHVLIRPEPNNMPLALRGDELLQTIVSKRKIRYLNIQNTLVRDALRKRGEAWRMSPIPRDESEIKALIRNSRTALGGLSLYYYNALTGTRYLTLANFRRLQSEPIESLRTHLIEIKKNLAGRNRFQNPEVSLFPVGCGIKSDDFQAHDFETLSDLNLRATYQSLLNKFDAVVPPTLIEESPDNPDWRKAMAIVLLPTLATDTGTLSVIEGLSPEFFMQIEWLPGGLIEQGELIFDPIFDELAACHPAEAHELQRLCDHRARGILLNYLREYSKIEYVNIGRTSHSLSNRTGQGPRARVYIVELKESTCEAPVVKIIRFQRWTIASHLNDGKELGRAILEAEEYTDYVLDRRLGSRQIGMSLPDKMFPRRMREFYHGTHYDNAYVWSTYFERDYITGRATDKIPGASYTNEEFCTRFCKLLGSAAAFNIVLGRARLDSGETLFDDGDEIITFDRFMMPENLIVSEPTGTFSNYERPFANDIHVYANAINCRKPFIRNFNKAVQIYLEAFEASFTRIQSDYNERRRAFHALFQDRPKDKGGIRDRWEKVLARLNSIHPKDLTDMIRRQIQLDGAPTP